MNDKNENSLTSTNIKKIMKISIRDLNISFKVAEIEQLNGRISKVTVHTFHTQIYIFLMPFVFILGIHSEAQIDGEMYVISISKERGTEERKKTERGKRRGEEKTEN